MTETAATSTALSAGTITSRRLADAVTMFVVSLFSVLLLVFIAHGTTQRTFEQLLIEKSAAQAELLRYSIEGYVRPGLPLRQYTGFNQQTSSIIEGDKTLIAMIVELPDGELVFSAGNATARTLARSSVASPIHPDGEVRKSEKVVQVVLPIKNKFERVGNVVLTIDRAAITHEVNTRAHVNVAIAFALCLACAIVVFRGSSSELGNNRRLIAVAFTACFSAVAVAVILSMISLFTVGAESKGRALATSLGQRFDDIPQLGLQLDQIEGVDLVLDSYRQLNSEISAIAITVNGRVAVHTDRSRIGTMWSANLEHSEYQAMLTPPNHPRAAMVILSVPNSYVFWQVARNVKNYAALFAASALFALLFLQVAHSVRHVGAHNAGDLTEQRSELALALIKPVFFLGVFVDHISYAFLPQFIAALGDAGRTAADIAWPYTAYYLCFALALVPAGHACERSGPRNLIVGGLSLVAAGLASMIFVDTLWTATLARAISGTGQGMLFIGVQSYILTMASRQNRTRSNGIIVQGFQGGMICGMAIGSQLVGEIGAIGVFATGAVIALLAVVYFLALMPLDAHISAPEKVSPDAGRGLAPWLDTFRLLRDPQFAQAILLMGVPAKAILTGVILFGLPILLGTMGFAKEDIGQITMIYAACVIVASTVAAPLADRMQSCKAILVSGGLLTAVGLMLIAATDHMAVAAMQHATVFRALLFIFGAATIGVAHGLINAPVVTFITETAVAARVGEASTAAGYRFLERCGHMLGPMIVGQLFLGFGTRPGAFVWLAAVMTIFAVIFHISNPTETKNSRKEGYA